MKKKNITNTFIQTANSNSEKIEKDNSKKNRIVWLDILKGFLIITVMLRTYYRMPQLAKNLDLFISYAIIFLFIGIYIIYR